MHRNCAFWRQKNKAAIFFGVVFTDADVEAEINRTDSIVAKILISELLSQRLSQVAFGQIRCHSLVLRPSRVRTRMQ